MKIVTFRHSGWHFVFGSNLAGKHGAGAARDAQAHYGARQGLGEGFAGRSYALPTKDEVLRPRDLESIRRSAASFLKIAEQRPDITFQVTRVGCGLAGFDDPDLAPIFEDCSPNVLLPRKWYLILGKARPEFRVIVTGHPEIFDFDFVSHKLDALLCEIEVPIQIVSDTTGGVSISAERYAEERGFNLARFERNEVLFGNAAGRLQHEAMAWYSDGACVFTKGEPSPYTDSMLQVAERENLVVREIVVLDNT